MVQMKIFRYDLLPDETTVKSQWGEEAAAVCAAGKSGRAKIESLIGYGLLRELLGDAFSPARLKRNPNGRPYLDGVPVDFSLSHTPGLVVCAVEKDVETPRIGVDAEALRGRTQTEMEKIAERWFTEAEQKRFSEEPSEEQFLKIWTAKEAMTKFSGEGLGRLREMETAGKPTCLPDGTPVKLLRRKRGNVLLTLCQRA